MGAFLRTQPTHQGVLVDAEAALRRQTAFKWRLLLVLEAGGAFPVAGSARHRQGGAAAVYWWLLLPVQVSVAAAGGDAGLGPGGRLGLAAAGQGGG